ncbi:MAG: ABC transporter transmembrane domain-containing protein [Trueperaceae bacterium]|nr:ABC transporter transmembrane domain-containing protein [Trueperaceae bacterium]
MAFSRIRRNAPTGTDDEGGPASRSRRLSREDLARLGRLFSFLRPHRGTVVAGVIAVAVSGALGLVFPLLIRDLLNSAFRPGTAPSLATAELNRVALVLLGLMLVQAVFNFLRVYLLGRVGEAVVADMRTRVFGHLIGLPVSFFETRKTGELTSRLTADIATLQAAVSQQLAQFVNQGITLLGGLVVLLVLEWRLTLLMLGVIPAVVVAAAFFGRGLRKASTAFQDDLAEATAVADEAFASVRVVKSFTAEGWERDRYDRAIGDAFRSALKRVRLRAYFVPAVMLAMSAGLAVVLWYGGRLAVSGALGSGDLVAFLLITVFVAGSIGTFTDLWAQLQQAVGASRRVFEILDETSDLPEPAEPVQLAADAGHVRFEDVGFSYGRGKDDVIKGVTLEARPGEVVAIVGPSGAGKSTLISLVPRFYDVTAGRLSVGGVDVRDLATAELRKRIGMVPQETQLFSGSILENLRYGRPEATDAEVQAAARAANAHDFITAFPDGYRTQVGERGVMLSGGQRQRLAIARALLKDPTILVLDEATSSLDSESEALVQQALDVLMRGRTTFVVAHRLSTVRRADRIVVLAGGTVVESGTHDQLLARGGVYAELYRLQFAGAERAGATLAARP